MLLFSGNLPWPEENDNVNEHRKYTQNMLLLELFPVVAGLLDRVDLRRG